MAGMADLGAARRRGGDHVRRAGRSRRATTGGDPVRMVTSPAGIGSSAAALAALLLVTLTLAGLPAAVRPLRIRSGVIASMVAVTGTVLVAGGYWATVFVQPGLAGTAPQAIREGLPSLTAGFVAWYAVMGLGWVLVAVVLTRSKVVRVSGCVLGAAGLLCISPPPTRSVKPVAARRIPTTYKAGCSRGVADASILTCCLGGRTAPTFRLGRRRGPRWRSVRGWRHRVWSAVATRAP